MCLQYIYRPNGAFPKCCRSGPWHCRDSGMSSHIYRYDFSEAVLWTGWRSVPPLTALALYMRFRNLSNRKKKRGHFWWKHLQVVEPEPRTLWHERKISILAQRSNRIWAHLASSKAMLWWLRLGTLPVGAPSCAQLFLVKTQFSEKSRPRARSFFRTFF